ncbi:hypothetical protein [Marinifilum caeruleilacunae]|uniref:Uncharacterized protein n=1 Tax=Marinifilum caeruleilacunae TaxID=2499076 RepID=A0ABX1WU69_9BACT|nr:hypothetical protein [Marinifilum caeruleilacunae]NOU59612.1 hypothetical protein [Marinifilum caeruleilacunae]
MKLFPTKYFKAELRSDYSISMENLISNTDITESLTSDWTKKAFRGQVNEKGFKIISSRIGLGAICILTGKFNGNIGEIEVRIHNAFKVMFSILMLLPIIGFGISILTNGIENSIGIIIPAVLGIAFVRFVFIELGFQFISITGINKLSDILAIKELNKI